MLFDTLLPTTLVGSYPQPNWLVDKNILLGSGPPRVRMKEVWRPSEEVLKEAQDDAALSVLHDLERAGLTVVGDGEVRRESYFNHFANALEGIDIDNPGVVPGRTGKPTTVPRVVGKITRTKPVQVEEVSFARAHTCLPVKVTIPGPFTMAKMALDEYYRDQESLIMAYAEALRDEIKDLKLAGADVIQIDDPHLQAHPEEARRFGVSAINHVLEDVEGPTIVHMCFGYAYVVKDKPDGYSFLPELDACSATAISIEAAQPKLNPEILARLPSKMIMYGVLDLGSGLIETADIVAARLREALKHIPANRLIAAPDCGMKYLPRQTAFQKLKALASGAEIVRKELNGS
jgi:5-methyltetrahydropteroyltriglutamate--homocysteine methyltransferase